MFLQTLDINRNIRVDKNFGFGISDFNSFNADDENLIKNLIVYMSLNFQKDLFGYYSINIEEFCKKMKTERSTFVKKHNDPLFFKLADKTKEELLLLEQKNGRFSQYRCWDSIFENALFTLQNKSILKNYYSSNDTFDEISLSKFTFVKDLSLRFEKVGKTKKIYYQYKLSEEFEYSLKKYFFSCDLDSFIYSRQKGFSNLYFKLITRLQKQNADINANNCINFDFKELAELLNISTDKINNKGEFSRIKYRIKQKFAKFIQNVNLGFLDVELDWKKGKDSHYPNIPFITFRKDNKEVLTKRNKNIYYDVFLTNFLKELSIYYHDNFSRFDTNKTNKTKAFFKWITELNTKDDIEYIKSQFLVSFKFNYGNNASAKGKADDFVLSMMQFKVYWKDNLDFLIFDENGTIKIKDIQKNEYFNLHHIKDLINYILYYKKFFNEYSINKA